MVCGKSFCKFKATEDWGLWPHETSAGCVKVQGSQQFHRWLSVYLSSYTSKAFLHETYSDCSSMYRASHRTPIFGSLPMGLFCWKQLLGLRGTWAKDTAFSGCRLSKRLLRSFWTTTSLDPATWREAKGLEKKKAPTWDLRDYWFATCVLLLTIYFESCYFLATS